MLDVSGGSAVATLQIPLELVGLEQAKAQIVSLGPMGEQAGRQLAAGLGSGAASLGTTATNTKNLVGSLSGVAPIASDAGRAVGGFGDANLRAAEAASHHQITLGRVERSLESFIVRTTGANEQLALLTASFGHLELGAV